MPDPNRQIPYNYTSADDEKVINYLFGSDISGIFERFRKAHQSRSARLLYRVMGDLFIISRNPFLFQELVDSPKQRKSLFSAFDTDFEFIRSQNLEPDGEAVFAACKAKLLKLRKRIEKVKSRQDTIARHLAPIIGRDNIYFDPFNLNAHATDATDWRMFLPVCVLRPDEESQIPSLLHKIQELGFHVIPRGAGTGLTGGATPLKETCVMINTEKLNRIDDIKTHETDNGRQYGSLHLEAGVITQDAIDTAKAGGFIFAADPTSSWGCTIGGNIAENAGGKTAVLYGTTLDNLLSYKFITPLGQWLTIKRQAHPLRKILPTDTVRFDIFREDGQLERSVELDGEEIRKKGLGKDVTNKSLNGLPGIQKEGCDGIITSAEFVLYPEFKYKKTICIEFFGSDMTQAGQVIAQITKAYTDQKPSLIALEHFDREYVKAIKYKAKTSKGSTIVAVLLIDMVSNDKEILAQGIDKLKAILSEFDKTGFSVAKDEVQAQRFWQDRKRLGAIAAHTNAFKLNEDIVLPIDSLADFARFVDDYNLEEKKVNQAQVIDNLCRLLDTTIPVADEELYQKRISQVKNIAFQQKQKLNKASKDAIENNILTKHFFNEAVNRLQGYVDVVDRLTQVYHETQSRLIVIATHMHAGDGNVHVNIPVLSNDRQMMERANRTADRVMEKAVELNGVVSGEHGIGVTKFKHLDGDKIRELADYRKTMDPNGLMNPGKLSDIQAVDHIFTTSFNLLEVEARILDYGALSDLALKIANCVRCGRCKPDCPVFYPSKNMFFHPRNKNLALISLIEALLYVTQRQHSTAFTILKNIEQVADHCTLCHRCFDKCPVNIDSGQLSVEERNILKTTGFKKTPLATRATLAYLGTRNKNANNLMRFGLLGIGATTQRAFSRMASGFIRGKDVQWPLSLLKSPVSKTKSKPLSAYLPEAGRTQAVILEPFQSRDINVLYFPGCGSERIFSQISMAGIFLLINNGVRVILPPANLCCGFPFKVNGRKNEYETRVLEHSILFSRIRDMFSDISFDGCVVSCGTCMESLEQMKVEQILGCRVEDISRFVMDRGLMVNLDQSYRYHQPCHDSFKKTAVKRLNVFAGSGKIIEVPHCCSEAGTLALSRPDISDHMLDRKKKVFANGENTTVLTNCPSCLQGLGRLADSGVKPVHIAVELARITGGDDWEKKIKDHLRNAVVAPF